MKSSFLMTPGPTQVPSQVSLAMAQEIIPPSSGFWSSFEGYYRETTICIPNPK